jgi:Tol biopolymer transport system component
VTSLHLECPHWSPHGTLIITCGGVKDAITVLINPDTGHYRLIFSPDPSLFITCPIMSPDTKRLLCDQYDQPADPTRVGLYTIRSSDGRGLQRITSNPGGHDAPGDYSPDGKQIVFARTRPNANKGLFVVNVDGSGLHRITPWGLPGFEAAGSWSPDGESILFGGHGSIFVVHPDGTGLAPIPLGGITGFSYALDDPVWSPDGTKFAFALFGSISPNTSIFIANADGTNVQQVTSAPIFDAHPDWGTHPPAT